MKAKRFIVFLLLLSFSFNHFECIAHAEESSNNTNPHITVDVEIIDTSMARVSGKSFTTKSTYSVDSVWSFVITESVSFSYGIVTSEGNWVAQITYGQAKITSKNSNSKYYPDENTLYTKKSNGNPATFKTTIKVYRKSNNALFDTYTHTIYCYPSGEYTS